MKKSQKRLFFLSGVLFAAAGLISCGGTTNPEANYASLINQSVPPAQAKGPVDQYMCGTGFVIQVHGHGDTGDLRFASGTSTTYSIELIKPLATPGMTFKLQASGPQGSTFTANDDSQHPELAGTYNFSWSPPPAGQNVSGVSRVLRITLKKTGDETQLDSNVRNCLDRSVTPVDFNLLVDGAGQAFDVSVLWPTTTPIVQENSDVPFTIAVTDETAVTGKHPHLEVGRIVNAGNELNAEDGSSLVTCGGDDKAVLQGSQWIYNCTFSVKTGAAPKQASRHKTSQNVQGQVIIGYRILAQSADGKQKSDFNDRRVITLSAPQAGKNK